MDSSYKTFVESGKNLITDTQVRKLAPPKKAAKALTVEEAGDPHKVFCSQMIADKPPKADLIAKVKKFIEQEEAKL